MTEWTLLYFKHSETTISSPKETRLRAQTAHPTCKYSHQWSNNKFQADIKYMWQYLHANIRAYIVDKVKDSFGPDSIEELPLITVYITFQIKL